MTIPLSLEIAFDGRMRQVGYDAQEQAGFNPMRYLQMVNRHGGIVAAHRLLAAKVASPGFDELAEAGFKDLSVEAVVLDERFTELFSEAERAIARGRLDGGAAPASADAASTPAASATTDSAPNEQDSAEPDSD